MASSITLTNFNCSIVDTILRFSFNVYSSSIISGYSVDYVVSNSLNAENLSSWTALSDFKALALSNYPINAKISDSYNVKNLLVNGKYLILKLCLYDEEGNAYPEYVITSLPRPFPCQTQIVDNNGAVPHITRTYKDGQWRQCRLQYYTLHPLISDVLSDQLLNNKNEPLYVAKKEI